MILAYFIGTLIGRAISSLSFEMVGFDAINILMCMLSKIFLSCNINSTFSCNEYSWKTKNLPFYDSIFCY